jgi:hypothetical protein
MGVRFKVTFKRIISPVDTVLQEIGIYCLLDHSSSRRKLLFSKHINTFLHPDSKRSDTISVVVSFRLAIQNLLYRLYQ